MQKRKSSSIKTIGAAIQDLLENLGIGRKIRDYDAVLRWNEIVGDQIARVTEAVKIEKGVLVVRVQNSPWRNELTLMKSDVIGKLNGALGEDVVKEIRFV
jgi:predicted nucleic acid-binding Zn ribbon protein